MSPTGWVSEVRPTQNVGRTDRHEVCGLTRLEPEIVLILQRQFEQVRAIACLWRVPSFDVSTSEGRSQERLRRVAWTPLTY